MAEPLVIALATEMFALLARRSGADDRVHVNVAVRFDHALIRTRASGETEITGGPLLSFEKWVPATSTPHVAISHGDPICPL
jgi:hypothetical protein